ncbi:SMP-30/gluconolactonase/LRE family protein [Pseudarthrobacter phenanthrenivorans]|uniref:Gluconolactonase n=1 Tax=Pseudarthrobacter phenanthrenivorans (strain DSM 18606 / JCM 16027 / LMG 23796 / Sphe3) TaxID=930171 RepID=F0MB23_PSEPM|nr:SMP-30/gluconolactonase/LRE family protein [Pseudarthrobacter phenanthrenivorans]ADX72899.1 gluconolactonase [Pseudarthrobacter phenanthrenivorans Sphe3]TPV53452.1 SMP-30/gluconolactonase/LRE family protein [Pseudarthrobacter phenanthrenivorans]
MDDGLTEGRLECLFTGSIWAEGPLWIPASQTVRWSDIPNNRILEFNPAAGTTTEYALAAGFTNGRTLDADGSVVQCSHGHRRVERDRGGTVTGLVDSFEGRRLNSPNDVVIARDASIWFTDPPYGILPGTKEGYEGEQEYGGCYVFRFVPAAGTLSAMITDLVYPNGLAFSPDESVLYVSDTAGPGHGVPLRIAAYDVRDGSCHRQRILELGEGHAADGFRVDLEGRIWTSAGPSLRVYSPDFELLATVAVPETVSNLCFGGADGQDLYITATTSLYRIRTTTRDATTAGNPKE